MGNKNFKIGETLVGEDYPVFFIAEIGINHNGDLQLAKRLIDAAFACGWDSVKFQKRVPEIAVPEEQKNVMRDTLWGRMTYLEYKKRIEFGKEEYDYIDKYCAEKPIMWSCSPWDIPSLEFLIEYHVPFIKIASASITNLEFVKRACVTGIPIILSTGMSTLEEVDSAVNVLNRYTDGNFALLHTNSTYPAKSEDLNLRAIPMMKERYGCVVGYSGHEYDINPTTIAAAVGAKIIERHITLDHNMWGTDQKSSLEIRGMDYVVRRIRDMENCLGDAKITVTDAEREVRKKLRG